MELTSCTLIVANIKLPIDASSKEAFSVALGKLRKSGLKFSNASCRVFRRSIDARRRAEISFVYSVAVTADYHNLREKSYGDITVLKDTRPRIIRGEGTLVARPMVVGMGP